MVSCKSAWFGASPHVFVKGKHTRETGPCGVCVGSGGVFGDISNDITWILIYVYDMGVQ